MRFGVGFLFLIGTPSEFDKLISMHDEHDNF